MCNQNHDAFHFLNDWCCICGHILLSPSTTEMREKAILLRCSCSTIHKYFSSWIIKMKLYASIMQLLIPLEMPPHLNLMCIRMKWCVYFKSVDFLFRLFLVEICSNLITSWQTFGEKCSMPLLCVALGTRETELDGIEPVVV